MVEALLIVIVLVLLGGAGWYMYHATRTKNNTQSSVRPANSSQILTAYTNTEFGFAFNYPKSWGSVRVTPDSISSGTTGSAYNIAWSSSPIKLDGTFTTRDYKVPSSYQGSAVASFAYSCPPQSFELGQSSIPVVQLYNSANTCVAVTATETVPGTYAVLGIEKAFSSTAKISGISFSSGGDATGWAVKLDNISEASVRNAFGSTQTQQLLNFAKSIHSIQ